MKAQESVYKTEEKRQRRENAFLKYSAMAVFQLSHFLAAALFASINELGSFSPFAVAFVCASDKAYTVAASFGAALGYLFTQNSVSAFKYVAAILCAAVMSKLCCELEILKKLRLIPGCVAFLTLFLADMAVMLADAVSTSVFLFSLGEAAVAFLSAFLFAEAFDSIKLYKRNKGIAERDMQIILFCVILLLFSVATIGVAGVSFSGIILVFLILSLSYIYGHALLFSALGATLVFGIGERLGVTSFSYSAAALVLGVFSYANRYIQTFCFASAFLIGFVFCDGSPEKAFLLLEAAIGCIAFAVIPEKAFGRLKILLTFNREPQAVNSQRQAVLNKLRTASSALGDISWCMSAASDMIKSDFSDRAVGFYSRVRDEVCADCGKYNFCWKMNFGDCKKSFDTMSGALCVGKNLKGGVPGFLATHCINRGELSRSFNENYSRFITSREAQNKIEKIRSLTNEQFSGICSMLSDFSEEFSKGIRFDETLAEKITEALSEQFSLEAEIVICTRDAQGHLRIEIQLPEKTEKLNEAQFREQLETLCRTKLSRPVVTGTERNITVSLCEQTKYRVEAAASRSCADNQPQCGDSYEGFYDGRGNYIIVLSDGMGTGLRAAIDSSLTATVTARLLRAGISCESALRTVNSTLLLRSTDESLATLDIVSINLYTGRAAFYKAGACATLVKRKSRVTEMDMASMPLGILGKVNFSSEAANLGDGDVILMASDGAFEYSAEKIKKEFSKTLDDSVKDISETALSIAKADRKNRRSDDITVITLRLCINT